MEKKSEADNSLYFSIHDNPEEKKEKQTWESLMKKTEALCPELKDALCLNEVLGCECIKHPLLYHFAYSKEFNAILNYQLATKKQIGNEMLANKEYWRWIFLHEKPYRLYAFTVIHEQLTDKEYWQILSQVWTNSENIWQNLATWKRLLKSKRSAKMNFMTPSERKTLRSLPETVTVYRGHRYHNRNGLSYTLDKKRAEWFSRRYYADGGSVIEKKVPKSKIFAYLNGRNEREVIIL